MGDITDLTVCELIEKLDKKELTSEEIVKAYSDRIKDNEKNDGNNINNGDDRQHGSGKHSCFCSRWC